MYMLNIFLIIIGFIINNHVLPSNELDQLHLNTIIEAYNPSAELCVPPINRTIYHPILGNEFFQVSCLVAGYRSIVITERRIAEQLFGSQMDTILKEKNIKILDFRATGWIYDVIFYSPKSENNALLLLKSIVTMKEEPNDYLWGTLLEYDQSNIEFFYALHGFGIWLRDSGYEVELPDRSQYAIWPLEMKEQFEKFEKFFWHSSEEYTKYQHDKEAAEEFIQFHDTIVMTD